MAGFAVDEKESIADAADGGAVSIPNVVVDDVTVAIRVGDGSCVPFLLVHGCGFAPGFDRVSTNVCDVDGICGEIFDVGDDGMDVAKAGDFLQQFRGECDSCRDGVANFV